VREECIDVETALRAYTTGSAYANFVDDERGALTPGYLADFALMSQNILDLEPAALLDTHVTMTVVGGNVVHND
jgi:hypothetical protein